MISPELLQQPLNQSICSHFCPLESDLHNVGSSESIIITHNALCNEAPDYLFNSILFYYEYCTLNSSSFSLLFYTRHQILFHLHLFNLLLFLENPSLSVHKAYPLFLD